MANRYVRGELCSAHRARWAAAILARLWTDEVRLFLRGFGSTGTEIADDLEGCFRISTISDSSFWICSAIAKALFSVSIEEVWDVGMRSLLRFHHAPRNSVLFNPLHGESGKSDLKPSPSESCGSPQVWCNINLPNAEVLYNERTYEQRG